MPSWMSAAIRPTVWRRAVEQDYALQIRLAAGVKPGIGTGQEHPGGIGRVKAGDGGGDPLGNLGLDLVEHGGEQVRLAGELVVERAPGHPGLPGDALGAHFGEALGTEQAPGRGDQRGPGLRRPLDLGPPRGRLPS